MPKIPALSRLRQESKFGARPCYTQRPCFKNRLGQQEQEAENEGAPRVKAPAITKLDNLSSTPEIHQIRGNQLLQIDL